MEAYSVKIEWDEDGCYLILSLDGEIPLHTDEGVLRVRLSDPEQAYDAVRAGLWPWIHEKEQAFAEFRQAVERGTGPAAEFFACKDPEGSWIRDIALGAMDVSESLEGAAAALDAIDLRRKAEKES